MLNVLSVNIYVNTEAIEGSDDEAIAGEYYEAKASKKEKKRQEREAQRQVQFPCSCSCSSCII